MTEQSNQSQQADPVPADGGNEREANTKQSLDDLYKQYYPNEPQPQPANPPVQAPPQPPQGYEQPYTQGYDQIATDDPVEARFRQLNQMVAELKAELGQERDMNAQQRQQMSIETQRLDIDKAIETLASKVDVPNKKLIKYVLADYWETNPTFQKIWEKRKDNPKLFSETLNKIVPYVQSALEVKADPDLVQKQMAMDQFNRTASSEPGPAQTEGERFARMSDAEFAAEWSRIAGRIQ